MRLQASLRFGRDDANVQPTNPSHMLRRILLLSLLLSAPSLLAVEKSGSVSYFKNIRITHLP